MPGSNLRFKFLESLSEVERGWNLHYNWLLLIIGGALMFSALYERCPIWKAVTTQFKKVTAR